MTPDPDPDLRALRERLLGYISHRHSCDYDDSPDATHVVIERGAVPPWMERASDEVEAGKAEARYRRVADSDQADRP